MKSLPEKSWSLLFGDEVIRKIREQGDGEGSHREQLLLSHIQRKWRKLILRYKLTIFVVCIFPGWWYGSDD